MDRNRRVLAAAALFAGIAAVTVRPVRRWYLHWGATPAEIDRAMPLDDRIAGPKILSTMAITIDLPPAQVWPWLVQIGDPPRAGY